jgi:hypothetical protein
MTEAEWLDGEKIGNLVAYVENRGTERKLRLFARACCHRIEHLLVDQRSKAGFAALEKYAEGGCSRADLEYHYSQAKEAVTNIEAPLYDNEGTLHTNAQSCAACALLCAVNPNIVPTHHQAWSESAISSVAFYAQWANAANHIGPTETRSADVEAAEKAEALAQCQLVRDIFGNPFHLTTVDSAWLTWHDNTVPKLAQTIYDDRAFDRLPILADALEEAGCDNPEILAHCRKPGEHVRGCWAVDLILGKK